MGNTLGTDDRPVYDDTGDHVNDLQAAADYTKKHGFVRSGTAADRAGLVSAQMPNGMLFTETDTGLVWLRRSGAWIITGGRAVAVNINSAVAQGWSTGTPKFQWGGAGSIIVDSDEFFDAGSNTRLTIPYTGLYDVGYNLRSSGIIATATVLFVNGVASSLGNGASVGAGGSGTNPKAETTLDLTAGDYLEVQHTSAATGSGAWVPAQCEFRARLRGML
jgi:hypothetical protein